MRAKIVCVEDKQFTRDYHDPKKRSIANALTVDFKDGSKLKEVVCEYPIGHKRRRKEGMPVLVEKFKTNLARRFPAKQQQAILELCMDPAAPAKPRRSTSSSTCSSHEPHLSASELSTRSALSDAIAAATAAAAVENATSTERVLQPEALWTRRRLQCRIT